MKEIPKNLDWVSVRAKCSMASVFDALKDEVQKDVISQNSLPDHSKFEVKFNNGSFTVISGDGAVIKAMVFTLTGETIQVKNAARKVLFEAGLTLNDAGECKLKVGDQELELWQFRRRALEELFFGAFDAYPEAGDRA